MVRIHGHLHSPKPRWKLMQRLQHILTKGCSLQRVQYLYFLIVLFRLLIRASSLQIVGQVMPQLLLKLYMPQLGRA